MKSIHSMVSSQVIEDAREVEDGFEFKCKECGDQHKAEAQYTLFDGAIAFGSKRQQTGLMMFYSCGGEVFIGAVSNRDVSDLRISTEDPVFRLDYSLSMLSAAAGFLVRFVALEEDIQRAKKNQMLKLMDGGSVRSPKAAHGELEIPTFGPVVISLEIQEAVVVEAAKTARAIINFIELEMDNSKQTMQ